MNFIDKLRIWCRAGSGGDGCLSFRREKYIEFGGPDGGDGGRGGDVALVANPNLSTLMDFSRHPHLIARGGENGKGSNKTGAAAEALTVEVPVGTLVYKGGRLLTDLAGAGERVVVARGGRGGRGNLSFKTQGNTAPKIAEKGEPGEEVEIELELRLIADVGLVGFPNAGKSSLLARVSNARPKIADYPFTTLSPHLGLVEHKGVRFVLADIPGLIEGAHGGKGLGDEFLRHVERTRLLVHLVDPLGFGRWDSLSGIRIIEGELRDFSKTVAAKPRLLVVTKMDLPEGAGVAKKIKGRYRARRVLGISSATGAGVTELLDGLIRELARCPREPIVFEPPRPERGGRVSLGFRVSREPANGSGGTAVLRVSGKYVERLAAMTNFSQPESVERFQHIMKRIGVDRALRRMGAQAGDPVRVGSVEMEWA